MKLLGSIDSWFFFQRFKELGIGHQIIVHLINARWKLPYEINEEI